MKIKMLENLRKKVNSKMNNTINIPEWINIISWISLIIAIICFIVVLIDIIKHPQKMKIMNIVWPVTMLFGSIIWLAAYFKWGKNKTNKSMKMMPGMKMTGHKMPVSVFIGTCHCGAGCSLADLIVEWVLFIAPSLLVIGGYTWLFSTALFAKFVIAYIVAYIIGISFQYFAIAPMRGLNFKQGIIAAIKADTLSLTSWQIGMYAIVALCQLYLFPLWFNGMVPVNNATFWLMMQIAMLAGFVTAYPVNWFLIKTGIKEKM